jgi:ubiquinone/menaquinone biosynthesis C-methylase UbiE
LQDRITNTIREDYDRLAEQYTQHLFDELRHKPLDRELLDRLARETNGRQVCDMGCGPGQVARYLKDAGSDVFGLDLSPGMVAQAQRLNPGISFRQGNMLALDLPGASLVAIAAFYAIVNIPKQSLPAVFQEMHRVLQPNGLLLLAFHIGNEVIRPPELWGVRIAMDFFLFQPAEIQAGLKAAGFVVDDVIEREPYPEVEYPSRRAYIFARRPALPIAKATLNGD